MKKKNSTAEEIRKETLQKLRYYQDRFDTLLDLCMLSDQDTWMHTGNSYVDRLLAVNNMLFIMSARVLEDLLASKKELMEAAKNPASSCSCAVNGKFQIIDNEKNHNELIN